MGGVGVEVEAAEMRHPYIHASARLRYAVEFLHDAYHVVQVLDHMLAHYRAERYPQERGKGSTLRSHTTSGLMRGLMSSVTAPRNFLLPAPI